MKSNPKAKAMNKFIELYCDKDIPDHSHWLDGQTVKDLRKDVNLIINIALKEQAKELYYIYDKIRAELNETQTFSLKQGELLSIMDQQLRMRTK